MKRTILFFLFLISLTCHSQLVSLVVRNDTVFGFNPSTNTYTQYTKLISTPVGQTGKVISSDGTGFVWADAAGGISQAILNDSTNAIRTDLNGKQAFSSVLGTYAGISPSVL